MHLVDDYLRADSISPSTALAAELTRFYYY